MERLVPNWVDAFISYTQGVKSPTIWRKWAALGCISSALQRRVWVQIEGQIQYPNLYVLFVGPPGRGKSNALKIARDQFLKHNSVVHLTPTDITKAALYQHFAQKSNSVTVGGDTMMQSPLSAFVDEWSVFVERNDEAFMVFLSDIYDNPEVREYVTKNKGTNVLHFPSLNMFGGVTISQLRARFTDQSLEGGFPARCILVYSKETISVPPALRSVTQATQGTSPELQRQKEEKLFLRKQMLHDLELILHIEGEMVWEDNAAKEASKWIEAGLPPTPRDAKLSHYATRRTPHFTKLCMCYALAKRGDRIITLEDLEDARATLLEAENTMGTVVSNLGANEYIAALKTTKLLVEMEYERTHKPVPEFHLRRELMQEIPMNQIQPALENLVKMRWILMVGQVNAPCYIPGRDDAE